MKRTSPLTLAIAIALSFLVPQPAHAQVGRSPQTSAPPGYTELRISPPQGGTVYVYEGHRLLGRFDHTGSMLVPTGGDYRVVAMRGDAQIWAGDVNAAGAPLDLDWAREPRVRQPFPPPPPRGPEAQLPPIGAPTESVLSTNALRAILRGMDDAPDDQGRLEALADATPRRSMSTSQATFILGRFRSDAYRLAALERIRDRVYDREDATMILDRFRNPWAKRYAQDLLRE